MAFTTTSTVPAVVPSADSDACIQCKTPRFPSPCDVEVQIIVDGDLVVRGSMAYAFYGSCRAGLLLVSFDLFE